VKCFEHLFFSHFLFLLCTGARQVVHPGPGHSEGTLVNALLHHCGLPAMRYARAALQDPPHKSEELDDDSDDDETPGSIVAMWSGPAPVIRPGIVHRLDKGTSGLLVVAKVTFRVFFFSLLLFLEAL
jgi:23S rRNA pseudouridine1911/1915/1917 synthase